MTTVQKTSQICTLAKTRHMIPCLPSHSDMDVPFVHVVQKPLRSMAHEILQCKPKTLKLGTKFSFAAGIRFGYSRKKSSAHDYPTIDVRHHQLFLLDHTADKTYYRQPSLLAEAVTCSQFHNFGVQKRLKRSHFECIMETVGRASATEELAFIVTIVLG
ncbi:hypothetical protein ABKN59_011082 [Abortiporus biennis]